MSEQLTEKYIKNRRISEPKYYFGDGFALDSGAANVWDSGTLDRETVIKTIDKHNLGSKEVYCPKGAREWGYTFFIPSDKKDGNGDYAMGGFKTPPADRAQALAAIKAAITNHYSLEGLERWESCNGHYLWHHYACEWGCGSVASEVGETISSTQTHIAFTRGAARQYSLPWSIQFSFWHQGRINDYTGDSVWGIHSQEKGGHSPSLYKRTFLASYMGGASHFYPEAAMVINYYKQKDADGCYKLSPIGDMSKQLSRFVRENTDIGINYVPFGIVLDYYHGMFPGDRNIAPKKVFRAFDFNAGDDMTYTLFDMFFPGSWITMGASESTYQVNGPYGDTCDVLLQNAPQDVLNSYPALILSGDIHLSDEEIGRYRSYVKQGGTLILNTAYLKFFPEYEKQYNGRKIHGISDGGSVVIYGPDFSLAGLDEILKHQLSKLMPFKLSEQVEYMVNVKKSSLVLTLINNDGYYFNHTTGEDIDDNGVKQLSITYSGGGQVKGIKELWSGDTFAASDTLSLALAPGEVKLLEFEF